MRTDALLAPDVLAATTTQVQLTLVPAPDSA